MNVDLHCHILPEFDDGSESVEMSLEMLRREQAQGVGRVMLTSHFYRTKEDIDHFVRRRAAAFEHLKRAMAGGDYPEVRLGAEVAMHRALRFEDLTPLCYEGTNVILLEMPFEPMGFWFNDLRAIIDKNKVKVVLAHVERFKDLYGKKGFEQVMELPVYKQINTTSLLEGGFFEKRALFKMVENGDVHLLGTDAHNLKARPVNMKAALDALDRKGLGDRAKEMAERAVKLTTP